jgi:hypothetical protein
MLCARGASCLQKNPLCLLLCVLVHPWKLWRTHGVFICLQQYKKLTNAQRSGLNQIPNRRFTLVRTA